MPKTLLLAVALFLLPTLAHAEDRATTKDAERLVHQAVAYVQKEGKDKAFAAFNDPKGVFTYRDLYIAVYDMEGKCLAHGQKRDRIGKSMINDKDADGKLFVQERVAKAKTKGKGWQDYKFTNPVTKKVEQKVAYFEVVDGIILVCGAYKP